MTVREDQEPSETKAPSQRRERGSPKAPSRDDGTDWGMNYEEVRRGDYSDAYFLAVRSILERLSVEKYQYRGKNSGLAAERRALAERVAVGDLAVDMQLFTRREPFTIVAGLPAALDVLRHCAGTFDEDDTTFLPAWEKLSVRAVAEGTLVEPWEPVMRLRGVYRHFCALETVILGILSRASRIATNAYTAFNATNGKPIVLLSGRFDHPAAQALDGYGYKVGLDAFCERHGVTVEPLVCTTAQARHWGEENAANMPHSFIVCFLRDTPEAMLQYARLAPPDVRRIALVDVNNDCVRDAVATAQVLFRRYQELSEAGRDDEARKFKLWAVRVDTPRNMRDRMVPPLGDPALDCGVNPRLVHLVREALDSAPARMNVPLSWMEPCRRYFRDIKIFVTGGFDPARIRMFEDLQVPVDVYGIGSYMIRGEPNDFTADLVEIQMPDGAWTPMAKAGRESRESPLLQPVAK